MKRNQDTNLYPYVAGGALVLGDVGQNDTYTTELLFINKGSRSISYVTVT